MQVRLPGAVNREFAMKFHSIIRLDGKTATGIPVPAEVVESLGQGKRAKIKVTIGDYTYRTSVAPRGGEYMIPMSAEHRAGAGVVAGDEVEIDIEADTEPRELVVPPDFAEALEQDPAAGVFFAGLSYSNQRRHVLAIEQAKTPETRQRRIEKAVSSLHEGQA